MPRLVRVVPVAPVPGAALVAHRALRRIARPAGTEFIDVREDRISRWCSEHTDISSD